MHHYGPYWHPFDSPLGDNYTYIPVRYRRNDLARLEKRLSAAHFFLNINVFEKILESVSYLDTLSWRAFEELVADLLQSDGYAATLGRGTKDEGIDIIATREFEGIGQIMSIWQAKKLKPTNKVEVAVIRELADTCVQHKASKGMIVTTTFLTHGALERVRQDRYILGKVDRDDLMQWIRRVKRR